MAEATNSKQSILVLGSEGQIGKPLVTYLENMGHRVLEFDIASDEAQDLRILNHVGYEFIPGVEFDDYFRQADFVFFLAFDVGGSRYLNRYQHSYEFLDNNTKIMLNTFDLLKRHNKPFIFASSQMSNMLHSPYGVSKALGEKFAAALKGLTVNLWNVYGPEHDIDKFHVISDLVVKSKRDHRIQLLTSGLEERQMLYVDDCCEALYKLYQKYDELDTTKPYHITSFQWTTVLNIAMNIQEVLLNKYGLNYELATSPKLDEVQKDIKNQPDEYILRYWRPKTTLKEGIEKVVDFYYEGPGKEIKL